MLIDLPRAMQSSIAGSPAIVAGIFTCRRSEEHTSELQSRRDLVCRLLLEKKNGFAAATYLRGVPVVQVPTTLLAQVDSAIGGKVGVNHALGKNMIGAFHQPALVAIDPVFLATLPRREFRAGLYEVIKYGVIASRSLFEHVARSLKPLFDRDEAALVPIVGESVRIKSEVVEADEREHGVRRI